MTKSFRWGNGALSLLFEHGDDQPVRLLRLIDDAVRDTRQALPIFRVSRTGWR